MNKNQAYQLFEKMIAVAQTELISFTTAHPFTKEKKADNSVVTACDKIIDTKLTQIAHDAGLQVISEEGEHAQKIIESGNYITIDPIDGTLGYIDYVNDALNHEDIQTFLQQDLGPRHDFSLLVGVVENGVQQYGACYCFVTKEKILIDGNNPHNLIRENNKRNYQGENVLYINEKRIDEKKDMLERELMKLSDVTVIDQATLGLKSLYTILNPHSSAATVHQVQNAGLWDVMPAAVAARAFGGHVYVDTGELLEYTKYIVLPPTGATILKGDRFAFVIDELKKRSKRF